MDLRFDLCHPNATNVQGEDGINQESSSCLRACFTANVIYLCVWKKRSEFYMVAFYSIEHNRFYGLLNHDWNNVLYNNSEDAAGCRYSSSTTCPRNNSDNMAFDVSHKYLVVDHKYDFCSCYEPDIFTISGSCTGSYRK